MTTSPPNINQAIFTRILSSLRPRSIGADYARYEACKAAWIGAHRDASSPEYEAAMVRIARECGV